jgi:hypothetical protein
MAGNSGIAGKEDVSSGRSRMPTEAHDEGNGVKGPNRFKSMKGLVAGLAVVAGAVSGSCASDKSAPPPAIPALDGGAKSDGGEAGSDSGGAAGTDTAKGGDTATEGGSAGTDTGGAFDGGSAGVDGGQAGDTATEGGDTATDTGGSAGTDSADGGAGIFTDPDGGKTSTDTGGSAGIDGGQAGDTATDTGGSAGTDTGFGGTDTGGATYDGGSAGIDGGQAGDTATEGGSDTGPQVCQQATTGHYSGLINKDSVAQDGGVVDGSVNVGGYKIEYLGKSKFDAKFRVSCGGVVDAAEVSVTLGQTATVVTDEGKKITITPISAGDSVVNATVDVTNN